MPIPLCRSKKHITFNRCWKRETCPTNCRSIPASDTASMTRSGTTRDAAPWHSCKSISWPRPRDSGTFLPGPPYLRVEECGGVYVCLSGLVHLVRYLLANRPAGSDCLSNCVVAAVAVPYRRHCRAWSARADRGDHHVSCSPVERPIQTSIGQRGSLTTVVM